MKGQVVRSSLTLLNVYTENVAFNRKDSYNKDKLDLEVKIASSIGIAENNDLYKVLISLEIEDNRNKSLYIKVDTCGIFSFESDEKLKSKDKSVFLEKNSLAILFPYARSFITNITSQSGVEPIILPAINISAMVDKNNKQSNQNDIS